ncbi:hypothetical protein LCGC14_0479550 [marine sediment metagenome]|uniref:Calcineurin-like phosphoesterase domain-containing protein n=1 Tax=marine sediment metagenome TaxID=412755 RepID=A0A0F9SF24_9ZZZZ
MRDNEFATSDHHFGHKTMLTMANPRPFDSVEEMNEELIARWNAKVPAKGAIVYHLGDFSWMNREKTNDIFNRLNGTIRLVRGNHDREKLSWPGKWESERIGFDWIRDYYESKTADGIKVCMMHYPFQVWNKGHYGAWMLHGHSHGNLVSPDWMRRLDVGVDNHPNYEPYSFAEIADLMKDRGFRPQDHHRIAIVV